MKPLKVEITGRDKILSAGKKYETRCQSTGSKPPAVLTWWKASKQLKRTIRNVSICSFSFVFSLGKKEKKKKKTKRRFLNYSRYFELGREKGEIIINKKKFHPRSVG